VTLATSVGYLCANFSLPRPLCSRFRPDVRDRRQTDRRQTKESLNASALWGRRHNNENPNNQACRYLAFDSGCKSSVDGNSVDGHGNNETDELNKRHPPRKTSPTSIHQRHDRLTAFMSTKTCLPHMLIPFFRSSSTTARQMAVAVVTCME